MDEMNLADVVRLLNCYTVFYKKNWQQTDSLSEQLLGRNQCITRRKTVFIRVFKSRDKIERKTENTQLVTFPLHIFEKQQKFTIIFTSVV